MFEKLFGNRTKSNARKTAKNAVHSSGASTFAPNTKIAYKPKLVSTLRKENEALLNLYEKASMTAYAGLTKKSKLFFSEFKDLFVDHILRENTSLYIYLQHTANGTASKKAIRLIKSEMDQIAREIMQFMEYCTSATTDFDAEVLVQIDAIGLRLKNRIDEEESVVYPNYTKSVSAMKSKKKKKAPIKLS